MTVIDNCLHFTKKNPENFQFVFSFFQDCLREKGEIEFRKKIVSAMEEMIDDFKEQIDVVLGFLASYMEDSYDE